MVRELTTLRRTGGVGRLLGWILANPPRRIWWKCVRSDGSGRVGWVSGYLKNKIREHHNRSCDATRTEDHESGPNPPNPPNPPQPVPCRGRKWNRRRPNSPARIRNPPSAPSGRCCCIRAASEWQRRRRRRRVKLASSRLTAQTRFSPPPPDMPRPRSGRTRPPLPTGVRCCQGWSGRGNERGSR